MSYLLLHNGNQLVKSWAAKFYNCTPTLCLVDPWPDASDLQQKYQLASKISICTDLTVADIFDIRDLFKAKQSLEIVKVITSYESDIANLEPVWHSGFDQKQWLISTFARLSSADRVVFLQPVSLKSLETENTAFKMLEKEKEVSMIVWRLDDSLTNYVEMLTNKVRKKFGRDLLEIKKLYELPEEDLNAIMMSAYNTDPNDNNEEN
jgi:hypothetical protein